LSQFSPSENQWLGFHFENQLETHSNKKKNEIHPTLGTTSWVQRTENDNAFLVGIQNDK
jgi:hypothetical protein